MGLRPIKTKFFWKRKKRQGQANGGACPCLAQRAANESWSPPRGGRRQLREQRAIEGLLQKPLSAGRRTTDDGKLIAFIRAYGGGSGGVRFGRRRGRLERGSGWRRRCNCRSRATDFERVAAESVRCGGQMVGGDEHNP